MIVRAPFDGVAISKDAQPGEMISPVSAGGGFTRTGICTIVDMASLEIEVDVNESYINRVQPGQPVEADARRLSRLADPRARDHDRPDGRSAEGDRAVRIGFEKLDPRILPDMGVKVSFLDDAAARRPARRRSRGCCVPQGARCVSEDGQSTSCSSSATSACRAPRGDGRRDRR